jgi:WD40 repeat protein
MQAQTLVMTLGVMSEAVWSMILNPITGHLVISMTGYIAYYDPITFDLLSIINTTGTINNCMDVLLPSGSVIVGSSNLEIYDPSGNKVFGYSYPGITRVKLLPDNITVILGLATGSLVLFNSNANAFGNSTTAHYNKINFLSVTPDHLYVISSADDSQLIVWTWSTMNLTQVNSFRWGSMPTGAILMNNYISKASRLYIAILVLN